MVAVSVPYDCLRGTGHVAPVPRHEESATRWHRSLVVARSSLALLSCATLSLALDSLVLIDCDCVSLACASLTPGFTIKLNRL